MYYIVGLIVIVFSCYGSESPLKELISPYIDEGFYRENYAARLDETDLTPVEHYMQHGWQDDWESNTDPASWFSTIIYKQLWGSHKNPLADWLIQPSSIAKETDPVVGVFCKQEEVPRAWLAIEDFLREKKKPVQVALLLQEGEFSEVPVCFKPQQARGLQIYKYSGREFSFYESAFLKFVESFVYIDEMIPFSRENPLNTMCINSNIINMHKPFKLKSYIKETRISCRRINIFSLETEPIYFQIASTKYVNKILRQLDLVMASTNSSKKHVIVPGYLFIFLDDLQVTEKKHEVSMLLSLGGGPAAKRNLHDLRTRERVNYKDRLEVWERKDEIKMQKKFYTSVGRAQPHPLPEYWLENQLPTNSKSYLMSSEFSIAIENCCQENYFTEKLLDCFISMVVPIYLGCPNITEFFNPKGMIIVNNVDEIILACNSLTPETYQEMLPHLQENHEKAKEFLTFRQRKMEEFLRENLYPEYPEDAVSPVTSCLKNFFSYAPLQHASIIEELKKSGIIKGY